MITKDDIAHVKRGFRLAGAAIAAFLTLTILILGLQSLRSPADVRPGSVAAYHPMIVGSCLVVIASVIIVLTMNHWVKALPGLLGYSIFGGLIAIAAGGFHSPSMSVPRSGVLVFTLLLAIDCGLAITFSRRRLGVIDRIALLVFIYSLALSMMMSTFKGTFAASAAGTTCLLVAALIDRFRESHDRVNSIPA